MQTYTHDIIIIGGGMVGLTCALALAKETPLTIAVLEAQAPQPTNFSSQYHHRVSAIALSSQRIFQHLGVWQAMQNQRVSPFTQIHVWDALHESDIQFDGCDIAEANLGFIIENNVMQHALLSRVKQCPQIELIAPVTLNTLQENEHTVSVTTNDDRVFSARLAIAADGAHSWLREQAGIALDKKSYDQQAIVATVHTALPHEKVARQVFQSTGPLAFLPLMPTHTSSIVWSQHQAEAERLLSLSDAAFKTELTNAFSARLGDVETIEQRYAFPLHKQQAKKYIKSHIALIGDAAHTLHPLAGQGVNMGLLDAASLAEVVIDAYRAQRDYASIATLRRYERWRRADNQLLLSGVDFIKHFFENDKTGVQALRSLGMTVTNQMRFLKNVFTRHAVGNRAGLPKLANALYF
jgi:2-octaprenylphenol hydroxylase